MAVGITWLKQVPKMLVKAHKQGDTATVEHIAASIQEYCDQLTRAKKRADTSTRTDAVAIRIVADIERVLNKYRTNLTDLKEL